jgi:hypothetical protein
VFLRFGVVSLGGTLSAFASGVGGKPGRISVAAWAWCPGLLLLLLLAPPLNKLKTRPIQDLELGSLVAAFSVSLQGLTNPALPLPACRGGEGKGGCGFLLALEEDWGVCCRGSPFSQVCGLAGKVAGGVYYLGVEGACLWPCCIVIS